MKRLRDRVVLARARTHRRRLTETIFVGVTGSAGKTTTKDLALAVLGVAGAVTPNPRSVNFLLDVALMLQTVKRSDRFTVVEVAATGPGSLDETVALTRPQVAALTVVRRDHIKNFDSIEAIAAEKGKLIHALPAYGTAVLNIDDPLVRRIGESARAKRLWFGTSPEADLRLIRAESVFPDPLCLEVEFKGQLHVCPTSLHGTHLATPVLAAIGIGIAVGIPIEQCIQALARVQATGGRMQIVTSPDGVTFLRDDFKAPYWAFQATLDYLKAARARRKIAVIGTLSDYSLSASKLYPKVARSAIAAADLVVFVGPHALRALKARRDESDRSIMGFTEIEDAHRFLQGELRAGDLVLLKGSNRADHLVRLMLAQNRPVNCWISGCGYNRFCDVCPRLNTNSSARQSVSEPSAAESPAEAPARNTAQSNGDSLAWLVVGLGNDGSEYKDTPHNIGYEVVGRLATQLGGVWSRGPDGETCELQLGNERVLLLKPGTSMNRCGPVVLRVVAREGIRPERVLAIHDDTDIPLGEVRFKREGSDGGHKGLRSLFSALNNSGFMLRLRVGVRVADAQAKAVVLNSYGPELAPRVEAGLDRARAMITQALRDTTASAYGGEQRPIDTIQNAHASDE